MGEFTNTPSIYQVKGSVQQTTTITLTDTWYNIDIPTSILNTFAGNSISLNTGNNFIINQKGIYVFQWMMACSGGANASYSISLFKTGVGSQVLNEQIPHTEQTFTTKGTGMWEVQNMFLLNNNSEHYANTNTSFLTYKNQYIMKIKNNTGTQNFDIENINVIVYKLN
jgi:hypothetical protein